MRVLVTILVCLLLLGAAAAATWWIQRTEPTAQRTGATRETAMLVEVTEARAGTWRPEIVVLGTVRPERDIRLQPRVRGEVVSRAPAFTPGGFVEKGDVLLRIDPADYENALERRRSELHQARADLAIERGRQEVARRDYELLDEELRAGDASLLLREPQLDAAQAHVESAQAAVDQAELDLARTTVRAPFHAQVLSRNTDVGSQVGPGDDLGRLVGVDTYWVIATVPLTKLRWIAFPGDGDGEGARVAIRNRAAWPEGSVREGHVHRLIGALDEETRLARVLVVVPDPLALHEGDPERPRLIVGSIVEARIRGRALEGVVRVDRDHLRTGDTVWTMDEGRLRIRPVEVVFRDAQHAYVADGLEDGARIVTTNLSTVAEGAALRLEGGGEDASR